MASAKKGVEMNAIQNYGMTSYQMGFQAKPKFVPRTLADVKRQKNIKNPYKQMLIESGIKSKFLSKLVKQINIGEISCHEAADKLMFKLKNLAVE